MENGGIISREPGLTVVELSGQPYDMGLAHGRLLGPEIALMRVRLLGYLGSISYGIFGGTLLWVFGHLTRRMEPFIPQTLKDELRGIADGSGQDYRFILLLNALDDVFMNLACSSVAVGPELTGSRNLLIGRNLDYPLFYDLLPKLNTVFRVTPDAGHPFVSVAWPGFAAVVTGMNDAGLFIADLTSITKDRSLQGTPALLLNRLAIQGSATIDELQDTYAGAKRTVGKNIMAASPDGARVLELSANSMTYREPSGGVLVATNHFEDSGMAGRQGSVKPPPKSDFPARYYSYEFSKERMDCLHGAFNWRTDVSAGDVASALGSQPVANESTVQSIVFEPATKKLLVAVRTTTPVSAGEYRELTGLL